MKDFEEKLRACLKRVVCIVAPGAKLRITEIKDRWPFPTDETAARNCSTPERVFSETFRGKIYYGVEIIYSREYMGKYDTK